MLQPESFLIDGEGALEERLGVLIEDDDVDAEDFTSFGSLIDSVERLRSR